MFKIDKVKAGSRIGIHGIDYIIMTSEDEKLFGLLECSTGKIIFDVRFTVEELVEQINMHRHHTAEEFITKRLERINSRGFGDSAIDRRELMTEILTIIAEGHRNPAGLATHYFEYDKVVKQRRQEERATR